MVPSRLALATLVLYLPAAAQFGNGAGRNGNNQFPARGQSGGQKHSSPFVRPPLPFPPPNYPALNPLWGSLPQPNFQFRGFGGYGYGAYPPAYGAPFWGTGYGAGWYGSGYYPPQAPANVTVVMPPQPVPAVVPQPVPVPVPVPVSNPEPEAKWQTTPVPAPTREAIAPRNSPAVIAIRNGNIYSASRYWIKGKTLHFIASNGEEHQVPLARVERLYAPENDDSDRIGP